MDKVISNAFAIDGILYSADSFVVAESYVLRINIGGKNCGLRVAVKPFGVIFRSTQRQDKMEIKTILDDFHKDKTISDETIDSIQNDSEILPVLRTV